MVNEEILDFFISENIYEIFFSDYFYFFGGRNNRISPDFDVPKLLFPNEKIPSEKIPLERIILDHEESQNNDENEGTNQNSIYDQLAMWTSDVLREKVLCFMRFVGSVPKRDNSREIIRLFELLKHFGTFKNILTTTQKNVQTIAGEFERNVEFLKNSLSRPISTQKEARTKDTEDMAFEEVSFISLFFWANANSRLICEVGTTLLDIFLKNPDSSLESCAKLGRICVNTMSLVLQAQIRFIEAMNIIEEKEKKRYKDNPEVFQKISDWFHFWQDKALKTMLNVFNFLFSSEKIQLIAITSEELLKTLFFDFLFINKLKSFAKRKIRDLIIMQNRGFVKEANDIGPQNKKNRPKINLLKQKLFDNLRPIVVQCFSALFAIFTETPNMYNLKLCLETLGMIQTVVFGEDFT